MNLQPRDDYLISEYGPLNEEQKHILIEDGIATLMQLVNQPGEYIMAKINMSTLEYQKLRRDIFVQCRPACTTLSERFGPPKKTLSTGIKKLDEVLGGGLYGGEILEICGRSGTGKTQMCMTIAAEICYQKGYSVVYLDLKNDFVPLRFYELCKNSSESINHIQVIRETNIKDIIDAIEEYEKKIGLAQTTFFSNVRLLILDSLPMALYPCMSEDDDSSRVYQERLSQALIGVASRFNIVIILTNHIIQAEDSNVDKDNLETTEPTTEPPEPLAGVIPAPLKPALGNHWRGVPHFRLYLSQNTEENNFNALLCKTTRDAVDAETFDFDFQITETEINVYHQHQLQIELRINQVERERLPLQGHWNVGHHKI